MDRFFFPFVAGYGSGVVPQADPTKLATKPMEDFIFAVSGGLRELASHQHCCSPGPLLSRRLARQRDSGPPAGGIRCSCLLQHTRARL